MQKSKAKEPQTQKRTGISFQGPFLSLERLSCGCAEHRGQSRRAPSRGGDAYIIGLCQGDYWIKITIWHFSFSAPAQSTERKLLQPSVPSSALSIASLAPLQPLTEKSFCQKITQCTDSFSAFSWATVYLTVEERCHNRSFSAFYRYHTLHRCVATNPWVSQGYPFKSTLTNLEENEPSVWIIFVFCNLLKDREDGSIIVQSYELMNWKFLNFLHVKALKSNTSCLCLCDIERIAEPAEVFYISFLPMSSFLLVLQGEWGIITLNLCCSLLRWRGTNQ